MKTLVSFICLMTFSFSALAFSRGPYLPKNEDIQVPSGKLVYQQGADESGEYRDLDWVDEGVTFLGDGVVQLDNGKFQIITLSYTCEVLDDGAYGALGCSSAKFVQGYPQLYSECDFSYDSFWCE